MLINEREELTLGDRFAAAYERGRMREMPRPEFIEVPDAYLDSLGRELASASQRPDVPYRFRVVNDAAINAFAVPGHIYVFRGLVELCETESELAAVLGHEIGHVVARHSAKHVSRQWLANSFWFPGRSGVQVSSAGVDHEELAGAAASLVLAGSLKKFSRDEERQADLLGVEECIAAGIDPRGAAVVFRKFETALKERPNLLDTFFNDHPWSAERAVNVERFLAERAPPPGLRPDRPAFRFWRRAVLATPRPVNAGPGAPGTTR